MRILMSLTYYVPNVSGLTIYAKLLAEELVQRGHEVTVMTSQHKRDLPLEELINGVRVIRVPVTIQIGKGSIMLSLPIYAMRWARWADTINCHLPQFESSLIVILAKLLKKKAILTHHTDLSGWPGIGNRISEIAVFISQFMAASLADVITVYTKDYANHSSFLKHFRKKLIFIYPPIKNYQIDVAFIESIRKKIGDAQFVIGFSGRIARQKGLPYLFEAITFLAKQIKGFKVVLAGPYKEVIGENFINSLEPYISKNKSGLIFLGPIASHKMSSFYSLLDVLVLPSDDRLESFGSVQVEAMLAGCPVVATNLPGARIPIRKTGMGELIKSRDPQRLARAILKVLTHKSTYIRRKEIIEKIFDFDKTIKTYEEIFRR